MWHCPDCRYQADRHSGTDSWPDWPDWIDADFSVLFNVRDLWVLTQCYSFCFGDTRRKAIECVLEDALDTASIGLGQGSTHLPGLRTLASRTGGLILQHYNVAVGNSIGMPSKFDLWHRVLCAGFSKEHRTKPASRLMSLITASIYLPFTYRRAGSYLRM